MAKHQFASLPQVAAWQLSGVHDGFEVTRFSKRGSKSISIEGTSVGVEADIPWSIHYVIEVDTGWHLQQATITDYAGHELHIGVKDGQWIINGKMRPDLAGCADIDLEVSAVTNTLPVHRLNLEMGQQGESAAVYIRANGLAVERLDQTYRRLPDTNGELAFDYHAPRFGYQATLLFNQDGLVLNYPDIARRRI